MYSARKRCCDNSCVLATVFSPFYLEECYMFLTHINIAFAHERNGTSQVLRCLLKYQGVNVEEQITAWKLNGFGYQTTLITDICNFMNYTTSPLQRSDGADPEEGYTGQSGGSCRATRSPDEMSWALFCSLGSLRLEECSQILLKGCGMSIPGAFFKNS